MRRFHAFAAFEDKKGNIWTSTAGNGTENCALYRYDEQALSAEGTPAAKIEPEVGMLFGVEEDVDGHWFGTLQGVGRYDGEDFEFFKD